MQRRNFLKVISLPFLVSFKEAYGYLFPPKNIYPPDDLTDLTDLDLLKNFTGIIEEIGSVSISEPPKCRTAICQACGDFCLPFAHIGDEVGNIFAPPPKLRLSSDTITISQCQACGHTHEGRRTQLKIMTQPRRILTLFDTFENGWKRPENSSRLPKPYGSWPPGFATSEMVSYLSVIRMMDVVRTSDGVMIKCR